MGQANRRGSRPERIAQAQEREERLRREAAERKRMKEEAEALRRAALTPEQREAEDRRAHAKKMRALSWLGALALWGGASARSIR